MKTEITLIKFHGWHEVKLDGNLLTGDTFAAKDFIKGKLNGKWDSNRKGWIVDLEKVEKYNLNGTLTIR